MTKSIVSGTVLAAAWATAILATSQTGTGPSTTVSNKTPNIAVSGCLMRQGYATFVVADAQVDGIGAKAATAPASTGKPSDTSKTPQKWVLENAGVVGQHVGERVQVVGISEWTEQVPGAVVDEPQSAPRIDVIALKVLAKTCS